MPEKPTPPFRVSKIPKDFQEDATQRFVALDDTLKLLREDINDLKSSVQGNHDALWKRMDTVISLGRSLKAMMDSFIKLAAQKDNG